MGRERADVLLVNPFVSSRERYGRFFVIAPTSPPLGICYIASFLRSAGRGVEILDASALGLGVDETAAEIARRRPRAVGFSATTLAVHKAAAVSDRVKAGDPGIVTLIGGAHVSSAPVETLQRFPSLDFGVVGEGEVTACELLAALDGRTAVEAVPGLAFRDGKEVRQSPRRDPMAEIDRLPMPAWDLLPPLPATYSPTINTFKRFPSTSLVTSRGCPGKCIFCTKSVHGNGYRFHSADYVMGMIEYLRRSYGVRDIYFHDDTLVLNARRTESLCKALGNGGTSLTWACFARCQDLREETVRMMRNAGCWQISVGIESMNEGALRRLKKGVDPSRIERSLGIARHAGLAVNGFFILGSPGETAETLAETLRWIRKLPLDTLQISFFTPYPGTEAHASARDLGRLDDDWSRMTTWYPAFVPSGLTRADLFKARNRILRAFYLRPRSILTMLKRSSSLSHLPMMVKGMRIFLGHLVLKPRSMDSLFAAPPPSSHS